MYTTDKLYKPHNHQEVGGGGGANDVADELSIKFNGGIEWDFQDEH